MCIVTYINYIIVLIISQYIQTSNNFAVHMQLI